MVQSPDLYQRLQALRQPYNKVVADSTDNILMGNYHSYLLDLLLLLNPQFVSLYSTFAIQEVHSYYNHNCPLSGFQNHQKVEEFKFSFLNFQKSNQSQFVCCISAHQSTQSEEMWRLEKNKQNLRSILF